jgi:PAS domain S-box-containing protein
VKMINEIRKTLCLNERLLYQAQQIAGLGSFVMDIPAGFFKASPVLDDIFGIQADSPHTFELWKSILHPDDRQMMADYFLLEVLGLRRRFNKEYRIIRVSDGAERWVQGHGDLELDENGTPVIMYGTIQDITERKSWEKALQQSETRYRELIDLAVDGILVGSHEGFILDANRYMCKLTGLRHDELVGKHISAVLFTPESLVNTPLRFDLLKKGETVVSERQVIHADGSLAFIEMRTKMMPDGTYQSIYRDITERKTSETSLLNFTKLLAQRVEERTKELEKTNASLKQSIQQLKVNQALLAEVGTMANVGGWELDLCTGKQTWTEEVYHIHEVGLDYEPSDEKGISFYAPDARPAIIDALRRCIEHGEPFDLELQLITAKGNKRWVHSIGRADLEHGRLHGTFQDVTERRLADDALREKNAALDQSVAQLRKLAMELTQAEELERKRLAVMLHDNVQQYMAAVMMKISLLDSKMPADEHARCVQGALALLGEALESSRTLTVSLCPPVLLQAGLMPGLRWLAEWMRDKHQLTVDVSGDDTQSLPGPLCSLLFQAVRELLFNIVKHAGVKNAVVMLDHPNVKTLRIMVTDNGKGFPAGESRIGLTSSGFGLLHLRERLAYIGGTFEVASEPGKGTCVTLTVPSIDSDPSGKRMP